MTYDRDNERTGVVTALLLNYASRRAEVKFFERRARADWLAPSLSRESRNYLSLEILLGVRWFAARRDFIDHLISNGYTYPAAHPAKGGPGRAGEKTRLLGSEQAQAADVRPAMAA